MADTPDLCDFYLGSVYQQGDLKIGISTNGKSPTMAKRFREFLEEFIPDNFQGLLDNMHGFRVSNQGRLSEKGNNIERINSLYHGWKQQKKIIMIATIDRVKNA